MFNSTEGGKLKPQLPDQVKNPTLRPIDLYHQFLDYAVVMAERINDTETLSQIKYLRLMESILGKLRDPSLGLKSALSLAHAADLLGFQGHEALREGSIKTAKLLLANETSKDRRVVYKRVSRLGEGAMIGDHIFMTIDFIITCEEGLTKEDPFLFLNGEKPSS